MSAMVAVPNRGQADDFLNLDDPFNRMNVYRASGASTPSPIPKQRYGRPNPITAP